MKVKFAIVSCGYIGKRHAALVRQHTDAELVATIDVLDRLILQLPEDNVPHFHTLEDFLKSGIEADVVNICTPNGLHASQAIQCLAAGMHVVIEKPIALNIEEANLIQEAANDACKHVFPVVQNRYSPTIQWLKEMVSAGRLGEIFMVQLNCFWNRDERYYTNGSWRGTLALDGGPLFTQFSHFIDVLHWVFGDIKNIQAKFSNFNHQHHTEFEDSGLVAFDLVNGGVGTINYSTAVYQSNFESSITVIAENGTVKVGGQYMDVLEYSHVKGTDEPKLSNQLRSDHGPFKDSISNHHLMINNVVRTINGLEKQHVCLADGMKVVDIINRIYQYREANHFSNLASNKQQLKANQILL